MAKIISFPGVNSDRNFIHTPKSWGASSPSLTTAKQLFREAFELMENNCASSKHATNQNGCNRIATPTLSDLNSVTRNMFAAPNLIIVNGFNKLGFAFSMDICNQFLAPDSSVAIYSEEISACQIGLLLLSLHTGIPLKTLLNGHINDIDWPLVLRSTDRLSKSGLRLYNNISTLSSDISCKTTKYNNIKLIIIDVPSKDKTCRINNKGISIEETLCHLKELAIHRDILILVVSHTDTPLTTVAGANMIFSIGKRDFRYGGFRVDYEKIRQDKSWSGKFILTSSLLIDFSVGCLYPKN
jgi:hypothetical protein